MDAGDREARRGPEAARRDWSGRSVTSLSVKASPTTPSSTAVCNQQNLPRPDRRLVIDGRRTDRAYFELLRRPRWFSGRRTPSAPRFLEQLIAAAVAQPAFDVDLVPVAIFWGRAPDREGGWWRDLFAEDWVLVGRFRRLLNVFFNGRATLVYFGEPLKLRAFLQPGLSEPRSVRRAFRTLRTVMRAQRASTIGPDLSHRRTMVLQILRTQAVRQAVRAEMQATHVPRRAALLAARRHAVEIAANYSQAFVSVMSIILQRLWNWLYDGVEIRAPGKS